MTVKTTVGIPLMNDPATVSRTSDYFFRLKRIGEGGAHRGPMLPPLFPQKCSTGLLSGYRGSVGKSFDSFVQGHGFNYRSRYGAVAQNPIGLNRHMTYTEHAGK